MCNHCFNFICSIKFTIGIMGSNGLNVKGNHMFFDILRMLTSLNLIKSWPRVVCFHFYLQYIDYSSPLVIFCSNWLMD